MFINDCASHFLCAHLTFSVRYNCDDEKYQYDLIYILFNLAVLVTNKLTICDHNWTPIDIGNNENKWKRQSIYKIQYLAACHKTLKCQLQ